MTTGPADEQAAGGSGQGHLRAPHADRGGLLHGRGKPRLPERR
jgi:hypothetical protein